MTAALEFVRDDWTISTDRARLNVDLIHEFLSGSSYWAQGRPRSVVQKSIDHSLCFSAYDSRQQVGFARVVTDYATFAWLCDVFIVESHRGLGLGKWLVGCVSAHPDLQDLRLFLLATRDAHALYARYARFEPLTAPERLMIRRKS